jgi:hypothetical protein
MRSSRSSHFSLPCVPEVAALINKVGSILTGRRNGNKQQDGELFSSSMAQSEKNKTCGDAPHHQTNLRLS